MRVMGTKPLVTTDKEVDIPKLPATYPELSPLVDKITEQSRTIQEYIYTLEEDKRPSSGSVGSRKSCDASLQRTSPMN